MPYLVHTSAKEDDEVKDVVVCDSAFIIAYLLRTFAKAPADSPVRLQVRVLLSAKLSLRNAVHTTHQLSNSLSMAFV